MILSVPSKELLLKISRRMSVEVKVDLPSLTLPARHVKPALVFHYALHQCSATVMVTALARRRYSIVWWTYRGLTVVGTQRPCRDAIGPHANGMVSTGSIQHSCLPGLFQQLSQRPGGRKESRQLLPGVKEESYIHLIPKAKKKRTQRGLKEVLLRHY